MHVYHIPLVLEFSDRFSLVFNIMESYRVTWAIDEVSYPARSTDQADMLRLCSETSTML